MLKGIDYIGVSAGAMIINDQGQIFLAQRGPKAKNECGCWENPGGGVEFGEKLVDTVKREIREEYGAEMDILQQFPAEDHLIPAEHQHWVATTFIAKFKQGSIPKIMEPEKCSAIGWFDLDKLPDPLSIITKLDIEHHGQEIATHL
jgi:mutator protein MutT